MNKYLIDRISPQETYEDLLDFPRYFEIETVNACNAHCSMCTIKKWNRKSKPLDDRLFQKIADELQENASSIKRVSLYRDGEPLMDRKIAQKIAMLKDGGINDVMISTNVSLLTKQKAEELLKAGLDTVIMSIDSLDETIYSKIRCGLNLKDIIRNALLFIEMRDKINPKTQIRMRMIRQELNYNEWDSYHNFWSGQLSSFDRIYYNNINNWGGQLDSFKSVSKSYEPGLPCVALWSLMVIFSNGDVPLCNADFNNRMPSGDIRSRSIREVWRSDIFNQRRNLHLNGKKQDITMCKKCNIWDEPHDIMNISSQYTASSDI